MYVKIKMAEIFSDKEELVATFIVDERSEEKLKKESSICLG